MNELRGTGDGSGLRIGIVTARFNGLVTSRLTSHCVRSLADDHGVTDIDVAEVSGARELPVVAETMARTGRYDAIIGIGCVIRGETAHFEYVAGEASAGLGAVATRHGIPVVFGVLTTNTLEQALERCGGRMGDLGIESAAVAVETANLITRIEKGN